MLNINALQTRKLLMFLMRLNGVSEKYVFSFGTINIAENFEVFENDNFHCRVLWIVIEDEWISVGVLVLSLS